MNKSKDYSEKEYLKPENTISASHKKLISSIDKEEMRSKKIIDEALEKTDITSLYLLEYKDLYF